MQHKSFLPTEGLGLTLVDRADAVPKENDPALYPFKLLGSNSHHQCLACRRETPSNATRPMRQPGLVCFAHRLFPHLRPFGSSAVACGDPLPLPTPDEMELDIVS
ncbi:hypothetical protein A0H81_04451 [Grifola frondosa]|uniref:Uncharacterized protein n=1 Tax=Grifola frondosa TaxID=5627 RepID=A0A1C7MG91_GRIFR|nr:hypothetical protein A0H81_04451 [Grifola frondosa]